MLAFSGPRLHSRLEGVLPLRNPGESSYSPAMEPCPADSLVAASGEGPTPNPYQATANPRLGSRKKRRRALQITWSGIPLTPRA